MTLNLEEWTSEATAINFVDKDTWESYCRGAPQSLVAHAHFTGFEAKPGTVFFAPQTECQSAEVFFGVASGPAKDADPFIAGKLFSLLPKGLYRLGEGVDHPDQAVLAFLLSSYSYAHTARSTEDKPRLCAPQALDVTNVLRIADAIHFGRRLVNTPANDMGPESLAEEACRVAEKYGATPAVILGDDLITHNFPLIHAVGRAAAQAPRLIDFHHGPLNGIKITLVGKGVCFDSGGLNIKPSSAMQLMKKDMGGAATALALATMIMDSNLPVRLRVLLPIVENSISANAFRPGDIYKSRKGLSVEVGDTDAEGRLILADALAYACEESPDLLLDFATLTGAARVALGPEIPPFYTGDCLLAAEIAAHAAKTHDPLWRMPLWDNYDKSLDGKNCDLVSVTSGGFSGSIIAALFLRRFVSDPKRWAHFDVYCWNPVTRPAFPQGGEVQAVRALFSLLEERAKNWKSKE